jgi:glycosyltransferase involved in cell wall biosynthesis
VQPSLCEAQGLAILEAMAIGNAVVASNVGGIPECLGDGGVLATPADSTALSKAILLLLDNPEMRERLAQQARQRVEQRFRYQDMVARTAAVFRESLGSRS